MTPSMTIVPQTSNQGLTAMDEISRMAEPPQRAPNWSPPLGILTWWDFLHYCWMIRACFVCEKFGKCQHRETEAESVEEFNSILRSYQGRPKAI